MEVMSGWSWARGGTGSWTCVDRRASRRAPARRDDPVAQTKAYRAAPTRYRGGLWTSVRNPPWSAEKTVTCWGTDAGTAFRKAPWSGTVGAAPPPSLRGGARWGAGNRRRRDPAPARWVHVAPTWAPCGAVRGRPALPRGDRGRPCRSGAVRVPCGLLGTGRPALILGRSGGLHAGRRAQRVGPPHVPPFGVRWGAGGSGGRPTSRGVGRVLI